MVTPAPYLVQLRAGIGTLSYPNIENHGQRIGLGSGLAVTAVHSATGTRLTARAVSLDVNSGRERALLLGWGTGWGPLRVTAGAGIGHLKATVNQVYWEEGMPPIDHREYSVIGFPLEAQVALQWRRVGIGYYWLWNSNGDLPLSGSIVALHVELGRRR